MERNSNATVTFMSEYNFNIFNLIFLLLTFEILEGFTTISTKMLVAGLQLNKSLAPQLQIQQQYCWQLSLKLRLKL